jgi:hypothetical protein
MHLKLKSLLSYLLLLSLSPLFKDSVAGFEEFLLTCSSTRPMSCIYIYKPLFFFHQA